MRHLSAFIIRGTTWVVVLGLKCLILILSVCWASSSMCSKEIVNHIRTFNGNIVAERVPWGRKFLVDNFHAALFFYQPERHRIGNNSLFYVRTCALDAHTTNAGIVEMCSALALYAVLVGNEVAAAVNITSNLIKPENSGLSVCEWAVVFPHQMASGNYSLYIWPRTINEFEDPTAKEFAASKNDRHNTGTTVSLSGLGQRNPADILPDSETDFTGHVVRRNFGKNIYLFVNSTTYRFFNNYDAFLAGKFKLEDVYALPDWFFDQRTLGPGLSVEDMLSIPKPSPVNATIAAELNSEHKVYFTFLEDASKESMVFDLPNEVTIASNRAAVHSQVRLCRDSQQLHLMSQGRWVVNPTCIEHHAFASKAQNRFYKQFVHGDECKQTEINFGGDIPHRIKGLTWRPWEYDLVQFDARNLYDPATAHLLKQSSFCDIINSIDGSSREMLRFSAAAKQYLERSASKNSGRQLSASATQSESEDPLTLRSLPFCLRSLGIGFIAGFGDSLGVEQFDNFRALLGDKMGWSVGLNSINCTGSHNKHMHSIMSGPALVHCIEFGVSEMMGYGTMPLVSFNGSLASTLVPEESVPVKTVVLITNFMAQHISMRFTLKECAKMFREQAILHSELAQKLKTNFGLSYRRIFMTGVSIHGFKVAGLTTARQQWLAAEARNILGNEGGFEIFDVLNITASRPDAVRDGLHYHGGASKALTDVLANILCVTPCTSKGV
jgi:hypothetical protein